MSISNEPPDRRMPSASVARAWAVAIGGRGRASVAASIGVAAIGALADGSTAVAGSDRSIGARSAVDVAPPQVDGTIGWAGSRVVDTVSDPIVAVVLAVAVLVTIARFVLKLKWRQLDRDDGDLTESRRWSIRRRSTDEHPSC